MRSRKENRKKKYQLSVGLDDEVLEYFFSIKEKTGKNVSHQIRFILNEYVISEKEKEEYKILRNLQNRLKDSSNALEDCKKNPHNE